MVQRYRQQCISFRTMEGITGSIATIQNSANEYWRGSCIEYAVPGVLLRIPTKPLCLCVRIRVRVRVSTVCLFVLVIVLMFVFVSVNCAECDRVRIGCFLGDWSYHCCFASVLVWCICMCM